MSTQPPPAPASAAVAITGLRKSFRVAGQTIEAVSGIDLTVAAGEIFGLLGPNGAGKTTTLRILTTLLPADGGSAHVAGADVLAEPAVVRRRIGYVSQLGGADKAATGRENLLLTGRLYGLSAADATRRCEELAEVFDLGQLLSRSVRTYSGGQRRRLEVALGIMHWPRVIFLDEPTTGLDPRSRLTMWQIIRDLAAAGVTILLTTQYLDEADQLADRIAVLDEGRIVAEGTPAELKSRIPGGHVRLHFVALAQLRSAAELLEAAAPDEDQLVLQIPADGTVDSLRALLDELHEARIDVERISIHTPDLDDVFFAVTGSHVAGQLDGNHAREGVTLS
jgi:ABC-2 type transport system ATP-binding protein